MKSVQIVWQLLTHIVRQICCMVHRGEIVQKAVKESGMQTTRLAKLLGVSRSTMYYMYRNDNLSFETIVEIGKLIHHDFKQDFKDLYVYEPMITLAAQDDENYGKTKLLRDMNKLQSKHIEALEDNKQLRANISKKKAVKKKPAKKTVVKKPAAKKKRSPKKP